MRNPFKGDKSTDDEELMTPDGYWNSQPPDVRELRTMPTSGERYNQGMALAKNGRRIDRAIMVDQEMDPYTCNVVRQNNGFTWVPAIDQPPLPTMPNCPVPGLPSYDPDNPPEGSIMVSILAKDYPPQPDIPPAPVPVTPIGDPYPMPDGSMAWLPGPGLNTNSAYNGMNVVWEAVNYTVTYDMSIKPPVPPIYLSKVLP